MLPDDEQEEPARPMPTRPRGDDRGCENLDEPFLEVQRLVPALIGRKLRPFGSRGRQEAADLVQEVLTHALMGTIPLDPSSRKRWVQGLVSNVFRAWLRAERRNQPRVGSQARTAIAEPLDPHPDPLGEYENAEEAQATELELARLPDAERRAFVAFHMEDQSVEEIARQIGRSVPAVRSLTKRAVAHLRAWRMR